MSEKLDPTVLYIISTPGTPLNQAIAVYINDMVVRRINLGRQRIWMLPLIPV